IQKTDRQERKTKGRHTVKVSDKDQCGIDQSQENCSQCVKEQAKRPPTHFKELKPFETRRQAKVNDQKKHKPIGLRHGCAFTEGKRHGIECNKTACSHENRQAKPSQGGARDWLAPS